MTATAEDIQHVTTKVRSTSLNGNPFSAEVANLKAIVDRHRKSTGELRTAVYELANKCRQAHIRVEPFFRQYLPEVYEVLSPSTVKNYMYRMREDEVVKRFSLRAWNVIPLAKNASLEEEIEAIEKVWNKTSEEAHETFLGIILEGNSA